MAIKPWRTLKKLLVHSTDKLKMEDFTQCVYRVPCADCDKTYIGETGRKLGIRLQEQRIEVDSKTKQTSTRSQCTASLSEHNSMHLWCNPGWTTPTPLCMECEHPACTNYSLPKILSLVWFCLLFAIFQQVSDLVISTGFPSPPNTVQNRYTHL